MNLSEETKKRIAENACLNCVAGFHRSCAANSGAKNLCNCSHWAHTDEEFLKELAEFRKEKEKNKNKGM